MRNWILILAGILSSGAVGQKYSATPYGLRDASNLENPYLVLEVEGQTALQLFNNALKYVNEAYRNPEEVIKGKIEGEYLKFNTYSVCCFYINRSSKIPLYAKYITELKFKDGKVRYEIIELEIEQPSVGTQFKFTSDSKKFYSIYRDENGVVTLLSEENKSAVEEFFNGQAGSLLAYLKAANKTEEW
jgi:hypothetical protein